MKFDETDIKILECLQENAKVTIKELSEVLNLTTTPIFERIKRLEESGAINGYHAKLNKDLLGKKLLVFCNVSLNKHNKEVILQFEEDIICFPQIQSCFHLTGVYDYLLQVLVSDMKEYQEFVIDQLAELDNIGKVQSSFVMTEVKNSDHIVL